MPNPNKFVEYVAGSPVYYAITLPCGILGAYVGGLINYAFPAIEFDLTLPGFILFGATAAICVLLYSLMIVAREIDDELSAKTRQFDDEPPNTN
jgi:hypothetical protein